MLILNVLMLLAAETSAACSILPQPSASLRARLLAAGMVALMIAVTFDAAPVAQRVGALLLCAVAVMLVAGGPTGHGRQVEWHRAGGAVLMALAVLLQRHGAAADGPAAMAGMGHGIAAGPDPRPGPGTSRRRRADRCPTAGGRAYDLPMITAVHTLVFAHDADQARNFFRDVLGFPGIDAGGGWLIFKTGPSELAVHPANGQPDGDAGAAEQFDVSLVCDDLAGTMAELRSRGAEFAGEVSRQSWGTMVRLKVPGAGEMTLYQPTYDPPATSTGL